MSQLAGLKRCDPPEDTLNSGLDLKGPMCRIRGARAGEVSRKLIFITIKTMFSLMYTQLTLGKVCFVISLHLNKEQALKNPT